MIPAPTPTPIPSPGWLEQVDSFIAAHHLGNLINIAGLAITILVSLWTLWNAKRAAEAANAARRTISTHNVMVDLTRAMEMMEEIRRQHNTGQWLILDRYTALRQCLRQIIMSANRNLSDVHRAELQATMQQVRDIEHKINEAIAAKKKVPATSAKLIRLMGDQIDRLNEILIAIRDSTER